MGSNPAAPTNKIKHLQVDLNRCGGRGIPTGYHVPHRATARVHELAPASCRSRAPIVASCRHRMTPAAGHRRVQWRDREAVHAASGVVGITGAPHVCSIGILDSRRPALRLGRAAARPPPKAVRWARRYAATSAAPEQAAALATDTGSNTCRVFSFGHPHP